MTQVKPDTWLFQKEDGEYFTKIQKISVNESTDHFFLLTNMNQTADLPPSNFWCINHKKKFIPITHQKNIVHINYHKTTDLWFGICFPKIPAQHNLDLCTLTEIWNSCPDITLIDSKIPTYQLTIPNQDFISFPITSDHLPPHQTYTLKIDSQTPITVSIDHQIQTPHHQDTIYYINFYLNHSTIITICQAQNITTLTLEQISDHQTIIKNRNIPPKIPLEPPIIPLFPPLSKTPKVSIIMTAYNAEQEITYSIQSILNQTYQNWELIIIDDGSIDNTYNIVQNINHGKIITIKNTQNTGTYASRNTAIEISTGQLITFQDADDYSHPERIEKQVKIHQQGYLLTTCMFLRLYNFNHNIFTQYSTNDIYRMANLSRHHRSPSGNLKITDLPTFACVTTCYRKEVLQQLGPYLVKYRSGGDTEMVERFFAHYLNLTFDNNLSTHTFCQHTKPIPNLYYRLDEVLYLACYLDTSLTSHYATKKYKHQRRKYQRNLIQKVFIDRTEKVQIYQQLNQQLNQSFDHDLH